jgi:hypothetical protein
MKVVGAAEIIVWWDAKCNLVSVEDAKSLWNGMDWIVGGSGSATCLKPPHNVDELLLLAASANVHFSWQLR